MHLDKLKNSQKLFFSIAAGQVKNTRENLIFPNQGKVQVFWSWKGEKGTIA